MIIRVFFCDTRRTLQLSIFPIQAPVLTLDNFGMTRLLSCALAVFFLTACGTRPAAEPPPPPPEPVAPAIAPGSVHLDGILSDCMEGERAMTCNLTVQHVAEYGAGTPQLPSGTVIKLSLRQAILDSAELVLDQVSGMDSVRFHLAAEQPAPDDPERPAWRASAIALPQ